MNKLQKPKTFPIINTCSCILQHSVTCRESHNSLPPLPPNSKFWLNLLDSTYIAGNPCVNFSCLTVAISPKLSGNLNLFTIQRPSRISYSPQIHNFFLLTSPVDKTRAIHYIPDCAQCLRIFFLQFLRYFPLYLLSIAHSKLLDFRNCLPLSY